MRNVTQEDDDVEEEVEEEKEQTLPQLLPHIVAVASGWATAES